MTCTGCGPKDNFLRFAKTRIRMLIEKKLKEIAEMKLAKWNSRLKLFLCKWVMNPTESSEDNNDEEDKYIEKLQMN